MTALSSMQRDFHADGRRTNTVPDMKTWTPYIRRVRPNGSFFVIVHTHKVARERPEMNGPLYDTQTDSYLLTADDINWPNHPNDPMFRDQYFHKSPYDPNIWILMNEFRSDSEKISTICRNS